MARRQQPAAEIQLELGFGNAQRGLPVAGADRMTLRDELAVEDCLALMRVALDPADDLALASVLKGPWCGLDDDDADIFPLAYDRKRGETLMSRLMAEGRFEAARAVRPVLDRADLRRDLAPFWLLRGTAEDTDSVTDLADWLAAREPATLDETDWLRFAEDTCRRLRPEEA